MLLQWVFYPLVLMQVAIGVTNAAFIDYPVLGFGFIPYSSLADDSKSLSAFFLQFHAIMAWVLIVLVVAHGVERWRLIFVDDPEDIAVEKPANV